MNQPILIGVDGGGTRCRVRAQFAEGGFIGSAEGEAGNIYTNLDGSLRNILALSEAALSAGGLGRAAFSRCHVGLGLAGANVPSVAKAFLDHPLPFAAASLESDAVVACRGAFPDGDGSIAIVGTGTAYVMRQDEAFTSIAGWGFSVSDQGSGGDLGRRALATALLAYDGIGPASPLTDAVLERFGRDPGRLAEFAKAARPSDFGGFAPMVLDHAERGDELGEALVMEGVRAVEAALRRLMALGTTRVALLGGLAVRYRKRFSADVAGRIVDPAGDAIEGALSLARLTLPKARG